MTQLYRGHGKWPPADFRNLSEQSQLQFYRSLDGMSGKDVVLAATEVLTKFQENESNYAEHGQFLPLGVWATQGFDAERIRTISKTSDIEEHAVLGTTYRVPIRSSGTRGREGVRRDSEVHAKRLKVDVATLCAAPAAPVAEKVAEQKPRSGSASVSSSSSSSSSSSKKKKSKKHKKHSDRKESKKNKKAEKKQRKLLASETTGERKVREKMRGTHKRTE
jgi:hypothetical protein